MNWEILKAVDVRPAKRDKARAEPYPGVTIYVYEDGETAVYTPTSFNLFFFKDMEEGIREMERTFQYEME